MATIGPELDGHVVEEADPSTEDGQTRAWCRMRYGLRSSQQTSSLAVFGREGQPCPKTTDSTGPSSQVRPRDISEMEEEAWRRH